jgi:hypothetical protein
VPEGLKAVVVILLGCIVASLGKALFHMSSGPSKSGQMVEALTWRIGLSVVLFVILMVGYYLHAITPHTGP